MRLKELYEAQTTIYRSKAWLLAMPIMGSPITPNSSAWLDAGLEALSTTSLTQDERIAASLLVTGPPVGTDPSFPATNSRDEPAG